MHQWRTISVSPLRGETPEYQSSTPARGLDLVAAGGLGAFIGIVVLEHFLEPSLNPLRHQVSEYANSPTGLLMVLGFVAWAISLIATSLLAKLQWEDRLVAALLAAAALGMVIVSVFPTETSAGDLPPGTHLTTAGKLHNLGSGLTSLALFGSALAIAFRADSEVQLRWIAIGLVLAGLVLSALLLLIGPSVGGLRQRLLLTIGCGWQLVLLHAFRAAVLRGCRRPGRGSFQRR